MLILSNSSHIGPLDISQLTPKLEQVQDRATTSCGKKCKIYIFNKIKPENFDHLKILFLFSVSLKTVYAL